MAVTFTHQGKLYIVLDEENMHRIRQNDPFEFDQRKMMRHGGPTALTFPLQIVIAYARVDELEKISKMEPDELLAYLQRGYRLTDSDRERGTEHYDKLTDALERKDDSSKH